MSEDQERSLPPQKEHTTDNKSGEGYIQLKEKLTEFTQILTSFDEFQRATLFKWTNFLCSLTHLNISKSKSAIKLCLIDL